MRLTAQVVILLLVACGMATAYPTSINTMPTAQTAGDRQLLFELANYGYPRALRSGSLNCVMFQYGIGPRIEFGVDRYSDSESAETYWNGKLKVLEENGATPDVAVGVMDLADSQKPSVYAVATKSIGPARLHAGAIRSSYSHGLMAGVDMDIGEKLWFGLDYLPGGDNFLRFGAACKLWSDSWLTLSVGAPNDRDVSDTEIGLTLSTYIDLSGGGEL